MLSLDKSSLAIERRERAVYAIAMCPQSCGEAEGEPMGEKGSPKNGLPRKPQ